jgi:uncharacterized protein YbjT (DUF2867 family)
MHSIVVTGATGNIGRELVRLLSGRGVRVRALARRPDASAPPPGVEWVAADLARPQQLPDIFAGADRLLLLTGNTEDMVRLQKNAIDAARAAGVKHVVKVSALGATDHSQSVIGLWHYNVERALRDSGLAWTMLRPHHFMQNLLDPTVYDRMTGRVHSASGDGRIPFIDTRDIAAAALVALTEDGHAGQIYTLTGAEAISYRDATEVLASMLGRPIDYVPESDDEAWQRMRAAGQPPWRVAALLAIAGYQRAGAATATVTDTVQRLTGRPPRTLREFIADHADTLRA